MLDFGQICPGFPSHLTRFLPPGGRSDTEIASDIAEYLVQIDELALRRIREAVEQAYAAGDSRNGEAGVGLYSATARVAGSP